MPRFFHRMIALCKGNSFRHDPRMWIWSRIASQKSEEDWMARLLFAGEERIAFQYFPASPRMRVQVYCARKNLAVQLKRSFGGNFRELKPASWKKGLSSKRKPISIRGKLLVCVDKPTAKQLKDATPILIPAEMAFGTGDHITTASCLRLLCDLQKSLPPRWRMLDLGTGSGILAIAAEKLGASRADALDFDPACIRITNSNAKANHCTRIHARQADILKNPLRGKYEVVIANIFADILIDASSRIAPTIRPGGWLIISGILRAQFPACLRAFEAKGFRAQKTVLRGKWASALCRKTY